MKKSPTVGAMVIAVGLTLAGCSGSAGSADGRSTSPTGPAASNVSAAGLTVAADTGSRLITAQGIGTVSGTPDVVTIRLGVETRSASAQEALDENNRLANDVITVIKERGVAPEDLQTSQLTISPSYDDKGTITGYQVTNMVTAKLRDIAGAGGLIDAVGAAAGDAVRVQQIAFSIDDDSGLRADARTRAVQRAQAQAQQMADAAGVALGPLHAITEAPASGPTPYVETFAAAGADAGSVPIEAGSQELSVVVQVVYEIG